MEDKNLICELLLEAVKNTRAGSDIVDLSFDAEHELVTIHYSNNYKRIVNVACDSGIALMRDVLAHIN